MLDADRADDGGGKREGDGVDNGVCGDEAPDSAGPTAQVSVADGSDSDSYSWSSSEAGDDLADDAVPSGGLVPFGLADPRPQLSCAPTFGNVAVANSSDIQFGNKTFFNGPVTIKQVVYAKDVEGAAATAVSAAGTGAGVAHVDPTAPDKSGVVAEGVQIKLLDPVIIGNGKKAARANGAVPSTSCESVAENNCCEISGFHGAGKTGAGQGAPRSLWRRLWDSPSRRNTALCMVAAALVLVGGIMSIASVLRRDASKSSPRPPIQLELPKPWNTTRTNVTLSGKLHIIPRREWLAQPRTEPKDFLQLPVPYVIISHSASEGCDTQASCTQMVRFIQTFHIESRGWSDIAYNFLVGGDGYVYEGRGWTVIGAHTFGYNNRSVGLNMVGTFISMLPSEAQMVALYQLIQMGVREGYIAENFKLLAHRQLSATESPGEMLYKELQTWPHWSENP